jgi:hypothetical protein
MFNFLSFEIQYIRAFNTKAKDFIILGCVKIVQWSRLLKAQNDIVAVLLQRQQLFTERRKPARSSTDTAVCLSVSRVHKYTAPALARTYCRPTDRPIDLSVPTCLSHATLHANYYPTISLLHMRLSQGLWTLWGRCSEVHKDLVTEALFLHVLAPTDTSL